MRVIVDTNVILSGFLNVVGVDEPAGDAVGAAVLTSVVPITAQASGTGPSMLLPHASQR